MLSSHLVGIQIIWAALHEITVQYSNQSFVYIMSSASASTMSLKIVFPFLRIRNMTRGITLSLSFKSLIFLQDCVPSGARSLLRWRHSEAQSLENSKWAICRRCCYCFLFPIQSTTYRVVSRRFNVDNTVLF